MMYKSNLPIQANDMKWAQMSYRGYLNMITQFKAWMQIQIQIQM